jgi:hypothetical protein
VKLLVMVEGTNFEGKIEGRQSRIGFVANRVVRADSVEDIDQEALFKFVLDELNSQGISPTPKTVMQITRVSRRAETDQQEFRGFSFFLQEGWLRRLLSRVLH